MQTLRPSAPSLRSTGKLRVFSLVFALLASLPAFSQKAYKFPAPLASGTGVTTQTVSVPVKTAGTIKTVIVAAQGLSSSEFVQGTSTGTCAAGNFFAAGATCTIDVTFQPKGVGEHRGAVVLVENSGIVMGQLPLYGRSTGALAVMVPAIIQTAAGNGEWLYKGTEENVPAITSPLFLPSGIAVDPIGNLYISDTNNNRIRFVDSQGFHNISTIAGDGTPGGLGDGLPAKQAEVNNPSALLLDGAGDLYIADSGNHAVRKLVRATGKLITIAGHLGVQGSAGDSGLAKDAYLNTPEGLAMDADGNLYIADTGNQVVRKIDAETGIITTYAGTITAAGFDGDGHPATDAKLSTPWGLAMDAAGNLYIADLNNSRIRKVTPAGIITTIVGTGLTNFVDPVGLAPLAVNLKDPAAVLMDPAGNLYIADSGHNQVLKLGVGTGLISVAAGQTGTNLLGDGKPATAANIYGPYGLTQDLAGNVYIADIFHHRIREIHSGEAYLEYLPIRVGRTSPAQEQIIENDGNAPLLWSAITPDQNATYEDAPNSDCLPGKTLAVNATCKIAVEFMPQVTGEKVTGQIQMASDAANSANLISLVGESDALEPTTTTLSATPNPSGVGDSVTFTALVKGDGGPSGNIELYDAGVKISSSPTTSGKAIFNINTLSLGTHTITAAFKGDDTNEPSSSAPWTQVVKQKPAIILTTTASPTKVGQSVTLTATVTATPSQPTGTVIFSEGSKKLATVALTGGVATFTTSSLTAGQHSIVAAYQGDTNNLSANSTALTQKVDLWSTSTTVASSSNPSNIGESASFTVTVTSTGTVVPTGSVTLFDGGTALATVSLDPLGVATYATSDLTVGTHAITAKYAGDNTSDVSTSTALSQVVQKISTTTLLSSSANPAKGGATVRLTATVTASTTNAVAGNLTGTVVFTEGATTLGSGSISTSGVVTADVSSLTVGTHNIVATYVGNSSYATSSSTNFSQEVELATTTVQISSSDSNSTAGNKVVFTAIVAGDGGVPTGQVTFFDGTTRIGQSTLNASGQGTINLSNLASGNHIITAQYPGDSKNKPSTSSPLTQVVQQAVTSITLTSSSNPAIAGTNITFAAAVSSSGSVPTGQLQLMEGATVVATGNISTGGTVQFTLNTLSAASHTLVAHFAGDADHAQATSVPLTQVVKMGATSLAITSSSNPSTFGTAVVFTAKITGEGNQPTGNIIFLDGANTIGSGTLNASGVATLNTSTLALGTHAMSATYAGDTTHNASVPAQLTQTVQQGTSTTLVSSLNPSLVGNPVVLTAAVKGAANQAVSGNVGFYDGGTLLGTGTIANGVATTTVSTLTAGTHNLVAKFAGDAGSKPSDSAPLTQSVNTADTIVTISSSINPAVAGNPILFTATVVSKGKTPEGPVTFMEGANTLGTANVSNGVASLSVNTLKAGQHAIVARYGGDEATQVSTSNVLLQVVQQNTTTALVSSVNPALTAQGFTLTATVTGSNPSGSITFMDGATILGTANLTGGSASLPIVSLAAGTHTLTAIYGGDSYNLTSTSTGYTQSVQMRPSTTSMTVSSQNYIPGEQVTLVAVVHTNGPVPPGGTVSFTSGGQLIGTANVTASGAATLVFAPTAKRYDVVAAYNGDNVYLPSIADTYTITLSAPGTTFTITTDPSSFSLNSGEHQKIKITVASNSSFTDTLSLGCLDLPAYATCTFSTNTLKLGAGGAVTADVEFDTGLPLGAGPRAPGQSSITLPAAVLLGLLLFVNRRRLQGRRLAALLSVAVLMLTGLGLTGCGSSIAVSSTPAGSYNVRIIATGNGTGLTQVGNVAVTVK